MSRFVGGRSLRALGRLSAALLAALLVALSCILLTACQGQDLVLGHPGCTGPPVSSSTRALLSNAIGFGSNAVGGRDGCMYHVTSLADSGPGTLREGATQEGPLWIVFDVSGVINLESGIEVQSDKTIDGRGKIVTLHTHGLIVGDGSSNVIVENLNLIGGATCVASICGSPANTDDAIRIIDGASNVWIDHCTLSNAGDGLLDITHEATDVTVSWTRFWNHDHVMLIGKDASETGDSVIRVTLHHNWWDQIGSYTPRMRFGKVHLLNNLIDHWLNGAAICSMSGELASESNIFVAGSKTDAIVDSAPTDPDLGKIRATGDLLQNGATETQNEPTSVFRPSDFYPYASVTADANLQAAITLGAGVH